MPSTNFIMTPSASFASQKSTTDLQIGPPRKVSARRFVSVTKARVPLAGDGESMKRLRILTRYPIKNEVLLQRVSTLPEVPLSKRQDNDVVKEKTITSNNGLLRVSSYPEINIKRQNSTGSTTGEKRQCKSETVIRSKKGSSRDIKLLKIESESSHIHTGEHKHRRKEGKIVAAITVVENRPMVSVKTIAQNSSRAQISVRQAINKYIALADRRMSEEDRQTLEGGGNLSARDIRNASNNKSAINERESSSTNDIGEPDQKKRANVARKRLLPKPPSGKQSRRYFKGIRPTLPKIITDTPACLFKLFGPILLSAPHGIKLWRGGTEGRRKRIHYREVLITEIVLRLSAEINKITGYPSSFVVWDRRVAMPADFRNLDPNYLTEKQFPHSPFHEALVQFKKYGACNKFPIMHVDVHGKKNRKSNMDLDIGFKAMENNWPEASFVKWLKSEAETKFQNAFNSPRCEKNDMRFTVNVDPSLCGDWGGDLYTMARQSVTSGIPAFQLEIPRAMRGQLIEDSELMTDFAQSIVNVYNTCINGGRCLHINAHHKEYNLYTEYLEKVYNDHIKIDKTFPEKQI